MKGIMRLSLNIRYRRTVPMVRLTAVIIFLAFLAPVAFADGIGDPGTIERITPLELKAKIDRGERIVIIDARSGGAYDHSDLRIRGDKRIAPDEIIERARELPMGVEIITYCT